MLDESFRPPEYIEDHAFKIDFPIVLYEGMSCGYSEREVGRMYYEKWYRLSKVYRERYNMGIKQLIFAEKPKVQSALSI